MNDIVRNELNLLKSEIENSQNALNTSKYSYEKRINNGLREEILDYLNNPPVIDKKKEQKAQNKRKWKEIKENIKKIFK